MTASARLPQIACSARISLRLFHSATARRLFSAATASSTARTPRLKTISPTSRQTFSSTTTAMAAEQGFKKGGLFEHNNTQPPAETSVFKLFSNKGKTAIVSGAGAGIGYVVAQALAESGANVAIWYNSNKKAIERAADIEKQYGVKCRAYQVDVTHADRVKEAIDTIAKEFNGRLDIFVANAGIPWSKGAMVDGPIEDYNKIIATDLDSAFYCARAAAAHWRRQKKEGTDLAGKKLEPAFTYGSYVATASMSGHIANIPQLQAAYNAAKAGVIHLCRSLSVEWVQFARANSISPGYMATEISDWVPKDIQDAWNDKIPMGRAGAPAELKCAYLYLCSDASSYTTGTDILVDGGYCAV